MTRVVRLKTCIARLQTSVVRVKTYGVRLNTDVVRLKTSGDRLEPSVVRVQTSCCSFECICCSLKETSYSSIDILSSFTHEFFDVSRYLRTYVVR